MPKPLKKQKEIPPKSCSHPHKDCTNNECKEFHRDGCHQSKPNYKQLKVEITSEVNPPEVSPPKEEKECECCKWDDAGYKHEPFCPLFTPTITEQKGNWELEFDETFPALGNYHERTPSREPYNNDLKSFISSKIKESNSALLEKIKEEAERIKEEIFDVCARPSTHACLNEKHTTIEEKQARLDTIRKVLFFLNNLK